MTVTLSLTELTALVHRILVVSGMSEANAAIVGDIIVAGERDGSASHGVFRVPGMAKMLRSGRVDGRAEPLVFDKAPGLVLVDARKNFTQVAVAAGRALLSEKARRQGMAGLAIRNAFHALALWPDVEPLAEQGLIALALVNSRNYVAPAGGRTRLLGTDPMAFACPRASGPPMVWDQSSSAMAHGEVQLARRHGRRLPAGVGLDRDGRPTTDPAAVLDGGALLTFAGHKGSSIALMVEILAAAFTGAPFGFEDDGTPGEDTKNAGELLIAIDPKQGADAGFLDRVELLFEQILGDGNARLPGDRRYAYRQQAIAQGIVLARDVYEGLLALARE